jgi:hypothetical protein
MVDIVNQDEIIEMAREVYGDTNWTEASLNRLEAFAKLAVAKEREACAKVCDEASDIALVLQSSSADDLSSVFLRHQTLAHQNDAAAIRARGKA